MQVIDLSNWNYSYYKNDNLKALVSFGAGPDFDGEHFDYFVTVIKDDEKEVTQSQFSTIDAACHHINKKFAASWDFVDQTAQSDSGCSSCVAK